MPATPWSPPPVFTPHVGPPFCWPREKTAFDVHTGYFLPTEMPPKMHAAGRMLGYVEPTAIEASGRVAGLAAAADCGAVDQKASADAEKALASTSGPARGL